MRGGCYLLPIYPISKSTIDPPLQSEIQQWVYIASRNLFIVWFAKIDIDIFRIRIDRKLQLHTKRLASSVLTSTRIDNRPTISSVHLSQEFDKSTKSGICTKEGAYRRQTTIFPSTSHCLLFFVNLAVFSAKSWMRKNKSTYSLKATGWW